MRNYIYCYVLDILKINEIMDLKTENIILSILNQHYMLKSIDNIFKCFN